MSEELFVYIDICISTRTKTSRHRDTETQRQRQEYVRVRNTETQRQRRKADKATNEHEEIRHINREADTPRQRTTDRERGPTEARLNARTHLKAETENTCMGRGRDSETNTEKAT